jgi:hypothetical protein
VSFHLSPGIPRQQLLKGASLEYLKGSGPIGARDISTLQALQAAGVPSYFSGCMTLTLQRPDVPRDENLVVVNELQPKILEAVTQSTAKKIEPSYHVPAPEDSQEVRFAKAAKLLELYARASCVITHRLHCALPCLAMGTPVLLIDAAEDQWRFDGLNNFVRHCTPEYFLANQDCFNVNAPVPNAQLHHSYRQALIERASNFISAPLAEVMRPYPLGLAQTAI